MFYNCVKKHIVSLIKKHYLCVGNLRADAQATHMTETAVKELHDAPLTPSPQ